MKVEEFMAYINNKLDIIKEGTGDQKGTSQDFRSLSEEYEEKNFIGEGSLRDELSNLDQELTDMSSLNIFGVSIDPTTVSKNIGGNKKNKAQLESLL